jgi:hypothetical protein
MRIIFRLNFLILKIHIFQVIYKKCTYLHNIPSFTKKLQIKKYEFKNSS